jgi:molybdate transport system substrate-binding protein
MRTKYIGAIFAVLGLALAGCSSSPQANPSVGAAPESNVTVFAASSLTKAFTELGKAFESEHPGVKVTFSFGASSTLAEQIAAGAPADVFASASKKSMDAVSAQIPTSTFMASNRVVAAFPATNPLRAISDLNNASVKWIQCDHQVPCGAAADAALTAEGVTGTPISLEPDVKSVVTKLTALEVDAAIVYITDVIAAGEDFQSLEFADVLKATTNYPIGKTTTSNEMAQQFVDFVLSAKGQKFLTSAGFSIEQAIQ